MKIFVCHNLTIIISESVLEIFNKHKQISSSSHESGGIIFGQIVNDRVYLTRASSPNLFDRSSRFRFDRDKNAAQILVNFEYHNSQQKTVYLGEWHTHPEMTPTPSGQDRKMIKDQFILSKLNEPFILLIIQGLQDLYVSLFNGKNLIQCGEVESI